MINSLLLLIITFFYSINANSFDWETGNITVSLSSYVYCDPETYLTQKYEGFSESFVPTYRIYGRTYDVNGVIGYSISHKSIYVVFRGTQSNRDWFDDFHIKLIDYPLCEGCKVHRGFYNAQKSVNFNMLLETIDLINIYPSFSIVLTGHSLGAALTTLSAFELKNVLNKHYTNKITIFTYGSPRIFNDIGSEKMSGIVDSVRVTHYKDIVVQVPPIGMDYQHILTEWYEDFYPMYIKKCEGYENQMCSGQWMLTELTGDDHMWYLNKYIECPN